MLFGVLFWPRFREGFGSDFGVILEPFWMFFALILDTFFCTAFWIGFWKVLKYFWEVVGRFWKVLEGFGKFGKVLEGV